MHEMYAQCKENIEAHTLHQRVILDMDSSESPVHGQQEGAAYNGHFECVCYHPLFLFNQFGDCEAAKLRSGNVHSADDWQEVLDPVVERYLTAAVSRLQLMSTLSAWVIHPAWTSGSRTSSATPVEIDRESERSRGTGRGVHHLSGSAPIVSGFLTERSCHVSDAFP